MKSGVGIRKCYSNPLVSGLDNVIAYFYTVLSIIAQNIQDPTCNVVMLNIPVHREGKFPNGMRYK